MAHLLVWSCGPVQDFIATARKGRDLWFGSWLLSEVGRAAALAAAEREGLAALVMPAPRDRPALEDDTFNVSNKLLVRAEGDPATLAAAMSAAARARLAAIAAEAFDRAESDIDRAVAEAQVADLLETHWAATDVDVAGGYQRARALTEALHAARKSERAFCQPTWGSVARKSSLDGARESVLPRDVHRRFSSRPDQLRQRYGAGPAEQLSGVDLLKRFGHRAASGSQRRARVSSTSHFAAAGLSAALGAVPGVFRPAWADYIGRLEAMEAALESAGAVRDPVLGRHDAHLLFQSRLGEFVPADALPGAEAALADLFDAWRAAARDAGHEPPQPPDPYFALLVADGDRLGNALDAVTSPTDHQEATRCLEVFATRAAEVVAEYGGQAVYAGGDDVLALLPTHSALSCARALRELFVQEVRFAGQRPTLSAGVCIAHHLDPLQVSLEAARQAERHAKEDAGRDAWAVVLRRRSGAPLALWGKWEPRGDAPDDWRHLDTLVGLVGLYAQGESDDTLPRGLPYDLRAAYERLARPEGQADPLTALRALEGRRLLIQKGLRKASSPPTPGSAAAYLEPLFEGGDLKTLADWLTLARALTAPAGGAA